MHESENYGREHEMYMYSSTWLTQACNTCNYGDPLLFCHSVLTQRS